MSTTATRTRLRPVDALFEDIRARHPRSFAGVQEARSAFPDRYADLADTFLGWAARAWGGDALPGMVDAFVRFTTSVNMSQVRYERAGHYENKTFQDCLTGLYIPDGGGFRFTCSWNNTSDTTVRFGESAEDEMCFFWAYYYLASP